MEVWAHSKNEKGQIRPETFSRIIFFPRISILDLDYQEVIGMHWWLDDFKYGVVEWFNSATVHGGVFRFYGRGVTSTVHLWYCRHRNIWIVLTGSVIRHKVWSFEGPAGSQKVRAPKISERLFVAREKPRTSWHNPAQWPPLLKSRRRTGQARQHEWSVRRTGWFLCAGGWCGLSRRKGTFAGGCLQIWKQETN